MSNIPEGPRPLAGIHNFGWVVPGSLARGEQPPLDPDTFEALAREGIGTVLSLRQDGEPARGFTMAQGAYAGADEAEHCRAAGLRFCQVGCTDYQAMLPDRLAAALRTIDEEALAGRPVFVHCSAGVGRSTLVAGAWFIAHGGAATEMARVHIAFVEERTLRMQIAPGDLAEYARRVGRAQSWWSFLEIARALGDPVIELPSFPAPEAPSSAGELVAGYEGELRPWRRQ